MQIASLVAGVAGGSFSSRGRLAAPEKWAAVSFVRAGRQSRRRFARSLERSGSGRLNRPVRGSRREDTTVTYPTIQRGSKGDAVKVAQQALEDRNYSVGRAGADGIFGVYTYRGVLEYQLDRSDGHWAALTYPLAVDGIVGPETWGRLSPDTIGSGSTGEGVRLLQAILSDCQVPEWDPKGIDGIFGPHTAQAVRSYQNDLDLTVDGIVGPQTWRSLWS
jgi:peptidoglycan hydrolase-like protein with peptidoglycan-binding domain